MFEPPTIPDAAAAEHSRARGVRILLCGLPYSPNLGDGIIADCAAALISQRCSDSEIRRLDLAGRVRFGDGKSAGLLFQILTVIPRFLRPLAVLTAMTLWVGPRLARQWREHIAWCDVAIIGGGQLLMDSDLNFPLKIHRAAMLLEKAGKPVSYYACGVAKQWSPSAARLFRRALTASNVRAISVRDPYSILALKHHLAGVSHLEPTLATDPALQACSVYGPRIKAESRPKLALGVSSPDILNQFLSEDGRRSHRWFRDTFIEAAQKLSEDFSVLLFSNGGHEDRAFLEEVWAPLASHEKTIGRLPTPTIPSELAALVSDVDVLVSHRLHANIIAYSYGIPSVGLGWDAKMKEFFSLCRREAFFLDGERLSSAAIVQKVRAAHAAGVAPERHHQLLAMTVEGSVSLMEALLR